jgi:hypothetical protein
MKDTSQLIELIGFDILFMGLITALTFSLARSLVFTPPWNAWNGAKDGARRFLGHVSSKPFVTLIALVFCAAGVGHVLTVLSDELLDGGTLISKRGFPYIPPLDDLEPKRWGGHWMEEDLLKAQALEDVESRLNGADHIQDVLRQRLAKYPEGLDVRSIRDLTPEELEEVQLDDVKGFFQHVKATVEARGNERVLADLRRGLTSLKLLSTFFFDALVLLVAFLVGLARWLGSRRGAGERAPTVRVDRKERLRRFALSLWWGMLLWLCVGGTLRLWTEHTVSWHKRLLHAYVVIAADGDPVVGIQAPAWTSTSPTPARHPEGK